MTSNHFPKGWDEERVKRVLDHYENQTDDERAAEIDAAFNADFRTGKIPHTFATTL